MATTRISSFAGILVLALTVGHGALAPAAEDDEALRKRALALNSITGTDPMEGHIKALLKDKEKTKQLLVVAERMARGKDQPFNYNAAFVLARAAHELKDLETANVLYRICLTDATKLQSGQKMAQAFLGLIDAYYQSNKFKEVVTICREFLDVKDQTIEGYKLLAIERLTQALVRQDKSDEALKLVDNFVEAYSKNGQLWAFFMQMKAWIYRESNRLDDAVKTYESVVEGIEKDKKLEQERKDAIVERNRYFLSGVYVDQKKIDKAAEQLQTLLKKKPDDPTYNNDLGYIWADNDMNLGEAEKHIRKAIDEDRKEREKLKKEGTLLPEADKDNSAYLDSLGWVLYKLKKFEDAKKYLLQAIEEPEGQHIEILDHLGDVHLALKEKDKAVAIWKKALDLPNMTKREQEKKSAVEKKVKDAGK
jgi:tetratricopeptide (TPR) repeat protein